MLGRESPLLMNVNDPQGHMVLSPNPKINGKIILWNFMGCFPINMVTKVGHKCCQFYIPDKMIRVPNGIMK